MFKDKFTFNLQRFADISNSASNTLVTGTGGDDDIYNDADDVTIDAGAGNDTVYNDTTYNLLIKGGSGNDRIENFSEFDTHNITIDGGDGSDTITSSGNNASVNAGAGNDVLICELPWEPDEVAHDITLNGGDGSDSIHNRGVQNVSIAGGAGNDTIRLSTGYYVEEDYDGDDYNIPVSPDNNTVSGGSGNDYIVNESGANVVFKYASGDGSDTIEGFNNTSILQINGSYSSVVSGNDVIVRVGESSITLKNARNNSSNISNDTVGRAESGNSGDGDTLQVTDDDSSPVIIDSDIKNVDASTRKESIRIVANDLNNSIKGSAGHDVIEGRAGSDEIRGGAGNDELYGETGSDRLLGEAGDDYISGDSDNDTLYGGKGSDTLIGGEGNDLLYGEAGNDELYGEAGDDTLTGGDGYDSFIYQAGDGNDLITDFSADDTLKIADGTGTYSMTKSGNDLIITVGDGKITLQGAASLSNPNIDGSTDTRQVITDDDFSPVIVDSEVETVDATNRTEPIQITANDLNNSIKGGAGNDTLYGRAGSDEIRGGAGNDQIFGETGSDRLLGEAGDDSLDGGEGDDTLYGGKGHDSLRGGQGNDSLFGEAGDDTLWGEDGDDLLSGGEGHDSLRGGEGNDNLSGDTGDDTLYGEAGNDTLTGGDGSDLFIYQAGDGNDLITDLSTKDTLQISGGIYSKKTSGDDVIISVGNGKITLQGAASLSKLKIDGVNDTLQVTNETSSPLIIDSDVEFVDASARTTPIQIIVNSLNNIITGGAGSDEIRGENGNDTLLGGKGKDILRGGQGNDSLYGEVGNDTLYGNAGNDTLSGGDGYDVFVYEAGDGYDVITDLSADDTLQIADGTATYSIQSSYTGTIINVGNGQVFLPGVKASTRLNIAGTLVRESWEVTDINGSYVIADSYVKIIDASKRTKAVEIDGNDLANTISGGAGNDTLNGGAGSDELWGGKGADSLIGGAGNDTLYGGSGSDVFVYAAGDGNDLITDLSTKDTLQISGGTYTTQVSGNNVIVTVSKGKITLLGAASLSSVNIDGEEENPWTLSGTTAKYGSITVKGVKSVDGLSLSGKTVTVSAASLGTNKVTISDGYTLALGSDVTKTSTKKAWSLSKTTAKYKRTTTAGYTLDDNSITYSDKSTEVLVTVKGVTSLDGLSVSGKVLTVSASSLGTNKVTISKGYTLALGSDVDGSTTKKSWTLKNSTATYKRTTAAGYSLVDNEIIYTKKSSKTLATVKGAVSKSGLKVSGKTIKLPASALSSKVTVSGDYVFDFASDYSKATITGSSSDDTIIARGKNIFVKGGKGSDVFALRSTGTIHDYEEEDKVSLSSAAEISVSGDDVIFNDKVTLKGAIDKSITYIENGEEKIFKYTPAAVKFNAKGTSVTLLAEYEEDSFDIADYSEYKNTVVTIKASAVLQPLEIFGNKKANKIVGTSEDDFIDGKTGSDTISGGKGKDTLVGGKGNDSLSGGSGNDSLWGGAGDDTLFGGAGKDIFVYKDGDGTDVIEDFDASLDKIRVLSGDVGTPTVDSAGDVTFAIGDGEIVVKGGADKYIPVYDSGKNILMKYNPR